MKNIPLLSCVFIPLFVLSCAHMTSVTQRSVVTDPTNGVVTITETTTATAYALLDSQAALTKFNNRSGYVMQGTNVLWAPGTYAANVTESSSSSNLVQIISAVAQGVVSGLKP